jgi:hypothetical protein
VVTIPVGEDTQEAQ